MQRLVAESRIEYPQETDLPVHRVVFSISTHKRRNIQESDCAWIV
jgi:hypothetical protein